MTELQKNRASSGIEALIDQLKDQGVQKGRDKAAQILKDAQTEAKLLLKQAQDEANQLKAKAEREAAQRRQAGEDALKMAARDLLLDVKESLARSFTDQVERLIKQQMDSQEFMQHIILKLINHISRTSGTSGPSPSSSGGQRLESGKSHPRISVDRGSSAGAPAPRPR